MRKFFGSTYYTHVNIDVLPNEKYLTVEVVSQWDFSNDKQKIQGKDYEFYIREFSKDLNGDYNHSLFLKISDLSSGEYEVISQYIDK